jgi:hypothetical protein
MNSPLSLERWDLGFASQTFSRTPWAVDQPVARPQPTHDNTNAEGTQIQSSMPCVGFELTIPSFERAKTFHVLDRATTMMGAAHPVIAKSSV